MNPILGADRLAVLKAREAILNFRLRRIAIEKVQLNTEEELRQVKMELGMTQPQETSVDAEPDTIDVVRAEDPGDQTNKQQGIRTELRTPITTQNLPIRGQRSSKSTPKSSHTASGARQATPSRLRGGPSFQKPMNRPPIYSLDSDSDYEPEDEKSQLGKRKRSVSPKAKAVEAETVELLNDPATPTPKNKKRTRPPQSTYAERLPKP